jgi:hypothetical protein
LAQDKLAIICGHKDWDGWNASSDNREAMLGSALTRLNASNDIPREWKDLGSQPTVLQTLLCSVRLQSRGDVAVHFSVQKLIEESVLALTAEQEQKDMIGIFRAVYGTELVH